MSLKFFADKLLEQIKGLEGFSASFDQLVALADSKPDELIEEWEYPELFNWLCLFDKEWNEDPTTPLKWRIHFLTAQCSTYSSTKMTIIICFRWQSGKELLYRFAG